MAKGRKRTPTAHLKARGSAHAKERKHEPPATIDSPRCPTWLDTEAKAEWRRVEPILAGWGVLSKENRAVLAEYCMTWSALKDLHKELSKKGYVLTSKRGGDVKNPVASLINEASCRLLRLAQDLGLTPVSRSRLHAKPKESSEGSKMARFRGAG